MTAFSRELRSFLEIAGERSIRGAAEKLNISPSALSRQVQILERDFGAALIVRLPQGIELTAQGKSLLKHAEAWLKDEENLRSSLHERADQWPAAGFVDTEIRCLTELESWNAEKEVQPRVQA